MYGIYYLFNIKKLTDKKVKFGHSALKKKLKERMNDFQVLFLTPFIFHVK